MICVNSFNIYDRDQIRSSFHELSPLRTWYGGFGTLTSNAL